MITLTEVARLSGVSASTVSNIINGRNNAGEATKQRVLKVIEETGYEPNYYASRMRKSSSEMIGIIAEDLSVYTMPIVEKTMAECEDNGYRTILINLRMYDKWSDTWYYDETKLVGVLHNAMTQLRSARVDGIIYIGGHCRQLHVFNEYNDVPIVAAYVIATEDSIPSVIIDDEKGGYDVTKYLLEMGHREIGVIGGVDQNMHTQKRLFGYQKALYEYNELYDPTKVVYGTWKRQSGYDGAKTLLEDRKLTAIFAMNDYMAAGAYDYCRENGIEIGKDISIVGYDDVEIASYLVPKLTTCKIRSEQIGITAAKQMIQVLSGDENVEKPHGQSKIQCEIIYRDSVRKI